MGFEKIVYLLLMGELPNNKEQDDFAKLIGECRTLPTNFTRDVIMKVPSSDIMNSMTTEKWNSRYQNAMKSWNV